MDRRTLVEQGPTLLVQVGFDAAFQPGWSVGPTLPEDRLQALVDTGATESCIDSHLINLLQLPIVDRREIAGVHGSLAVNVCLAQIYIPDLRFTVYGRFAAVHLAASGQQHYALLGRTFLQNFTTTYEGQTGFVTISND